jgi:hypothetical protein
MRLPPVRFSEVGTFRRPGDDDGVPRLPPGGTMPADVPWKDGHPSDPAQRPEPGFQEVDSWVWEGVEGLVNKPASHSRPPPIDGEADDGAV